ncbi:molybdenum cofactor guanylyltransferase [Colwellia echini]|uniref:Molybdenum cofactor guanylyltransferase n=1 Tax=Colwellia echini TaxID=1982103 RepID=A0ABY3N0S7_9GAMM|nr:molybdenum cofactor guanylyltransferase [Colwellia echini]TYK67096.1 molybdenum cofactor guanylyltransferase [Colwellia echini]
MLIQDIGDLNNKHLAVDCLGVVLAGGLSSRMGQDKAQLTRSNDTLNKASTHSWAQTSGQSMLDFSKQLLTDSGIANIVISGDHHQIPDLVPQSGPVGGIYSVLAHCLQQYPEHLQPKSFLILPVDLPLMTPAAIAELRLKGELSRKATFFSDTQKQIHHIPLYLPNNAFLSAFLSQAFHQYILVNQDSNRVKGENKNAPSVRSMLAKIPHQAISSKNSKLLFNTNTPEQWHQAQQQFK